MAGRQATHGLRSVKEALRWVQWAGACSGLSEIPGTSEQDSGKCPSGAQLWDHAAATPAVLGKPAHSGQDSSRGPNRAEGLLPTCPLLATSPPTRAPPHPGCPFPVRLVWLPCPAGLIALSTRPHPEGSSWSLFRFAGSELTPDTQLPLRTRSQGAQSPSELGLSSQGPNPLSLHQGLQTPLHLSAMPQKTCYPVPNLPLTFPYPPLHSLHISTLPTRG